MNIAIVSIISLLVNIALGKYRAKYRKMSLRWWLLIHASIPLIIPLRIWLDTPNVAIILFVSLAVVGQMIGSKWLAKIVVGRRR